MVYFLMGLYNTNKIEGLILSLNYKKEPFTCFGMIKHRYISPDGQLIINLTSESEGKIQIQGNGLADLYEKRENSIHYSKLEELAKTLKPKRVVDSIMEDIFPELSQKIQ